ncbi:3861_t:CDS:2 [Paraglomus occultum]|uniref:3861_t:CDS:1 n=1 Tax=Paraglomus occultum TaxID=144539 RepID=A0A9N9H0N6_9GLOM|nr:3861_t:CDS:2 [Paraglomus occultum]
MAERRLLRAVFVRGAENRFLRAENRFLRAEKRFTTTNNVQATHTPSSWRWQEFGAFIGILATMFGGFGWAMDAKIGGLDAKIGGLDAKIGGLGERMDRFETRIEARIGELEEKVDDLNVKVHEIRGWMARDSPEKEQQHC